MNARNLRSGIECGLAHVKERVLYAHAVVRGEILSA